MVKEINKLVSTNFYAAMELKSLPKSEPYSQKEAQEMCKIIGNVYSIAHSISCDACGMKHRL